MFLALQFPTGPDVDLRDLREWWAEHQALYRLRMSAGNAYLHAKKASEASDAATRSPPPQVPGTKVIVCMHRRPLHTRVLPSRQ